MSTEARKLYLTESLNKLTVDNINDFSRQSQTNKDILNYFKAITRAAIYPELVAIREHDLEFLRDENIATAPQKYFEFLNRYILPMAQKVPLEVQQYFYDTSMIKGKEPLNPNFTPFDFAINNFMFLIINPLIADARNELVKLNKSELKALEVLAKKELVGEMACKPVEEQREITDEDIFERVIELMRFIVGEKVRKETYSTQERRDLNEKLINLFLKSSNQPLSAPDLKIDVMKIYLIPFYCYFLEQSEPSSKLELINFKREFSPKFFRNVVSRRSH